MNTGIHGTDSSLELYDNVFHSSPTFGVGIIAGVRAIGSANAPIINIHDNNLDVLRWGMLFIEMGGAGAFNVYDNDIEVGDVAIDPVFSGFSGIDIHNSEFSTVTQATIENNTIDMYAARLGIQAFGCSSLNLFDNNITTHPDEGTLVTHGMIFISSSKMNVRGNSAFSIAGPQNPYVESGISVLETDNSVYCCNTLNGTWNGFIFDGTCLGTFFRGTIFGDAQVGLLYREDARTSSQIIANNLWTGNFSDVAARHETTDQNIFNSSRYWVNPFTPPTLPPSIDASFPNWFSSWPQPPDFTCPSPDCSTFTEPPQIDTADFLIANGGWNSELLYHNTLEWSGERFLLAKLDAHPELMRGEPILQTFHTDKQGTTVDLFNDIDEGVDGLSELAPTETTRYTSNLATIFSLLHDISDIDSLLFIATGAQATTLQDDREDLLETLAALETENDSLLNIIQTARLTSIQQLITDNNSIVVTETFEQNEKKVNEIWLNTVALGIYSFTPVQVADLENIIFQCPKFGGKAVYMARGLYQLMAHVEYDDELNCNGIGERSSGQTEPEAGSFQLFPNPASNLFILLLNEKMDIPATLLLTDLSGKTVQVHHLPIGQSHFSFGVGGLPGGIYFCKITSGREQVFVQKLVISR